MILLREIQDKDLEHLERFSQIPGFINLPNDRDLLKEKISRSMNSFRGKYKEFEETKYIFAAEDLETGKVIGTSMIAAQHGTEDSPHFFFEVGQEEKYSETINTGFIHGTLKLRYDSNGPSEIGGLVIDPEYRNSAHRVGRQISFIRFLFLGLYPELFKEKVIAELLPPLNKKGQSPLWEAIGRRFTNMDYWEADQLCQKNKEFIFSLFPTGKIYTSFMTAEARNSVGKVGKETEPVLHMLKKIGFEYKYNVDPFDGGPHLWANVEDITPIQRITKGQWKWGNENDSGFEHGLLTSALKNPRDFSAMDVEAKLENNWVVIKSSNKAAVEDRLNLEKDSEVAFMPYY